MLRLNIIGLSYCLIRNEPRNVPRNERRNELRIEPRNEPRNERPISDEPRNERPSSDEPRNEPRNDPHNELTTRKREREDLERLGLGEREIGHSRNCIGY